MPSHLNVAGRYVDVVEALAAAAVHAELPFTRELEDEMMEQFITPEYLPRLRMAVSFLSIEHSDLCRVSIGDAGWENESASSNGSGADDGNRSALNGCVGSPPADSIDTGIVPASAATPRLSHCTDSSMPKRTTDDTQQIPKAELTLPPVPDPGQFLGLPQDEALDWAEALTGWPTRNDETGEQHHEGKKEQSETGCVYLFRPAKMMGKLEPEKHRSRHRAGGVDLAAATPAGPQEGATENAETSTDVSAGDWELNIDAPFGGAAEMSTEMSASAGGSAVVVGANFGYMIDKPPTVYCPPSRLVPNAEPDWQRAYTALWNHEFVLAKDFGNGRHDQEDGKAFASVRKAMASGLKPLSPYSTIILSTMQDDLKEESKVRREGAITLRAAAQHVRQGLQEYADLLHIIDAGLS
ncbi:hypothetical protein FIBSPDRAFT_943198 [Athelia psychrophila]|uniref:Uncharacterized protein n=1 Tax=Athelia psychrophila TaxID=1759441 RepID=A0A166W4P0_9AGAM|nr:hypothetical protein FIBSPDRAFT_943198 [Fibularhizoctonia sp. CBS 109695]